MADQDPASTSMLEAVRIEVTARGLTRARMTAIAQRAGISRATLYRRGKSLEQLVLDALVADFEDLLLAVTPPSGEVTRADIVAAGRLAAQKVGTNDFVRALLAHDAHLLTPYLVERFGRSQQAVLDALHLAIAAGQVHGSVRPGPPEVLAVGVLQAVTPYVIGARPLADIAPTEVWLDEVELILDRYLAPDPGLFL